MGASSFLRPCGSLGSNSGPQAWQQTPYLLCHLAGIFTLCLGQSLSLNLDLTDLTRLVSWQVTEMILSLPLQG